jgi:hypothetical protein
MDSQTYNSLTSKMRWLVRWNIALTVLFLIALGANTVLARAAYDPPARVFVASGVNDGGGHDEQVVPIGIGVDSTDPVVLASVEVNLKNGQDHVCLATASALAVRSSGGGLWEYGLGLDSPTVVIESVRTIEFEPFAAGGVSRREVSTVLGFDGLSGQHTIYFLANKNTAADPNSRAFNPSLVVACFKDQL